MKKETNREIKPFGHNVRRFLLEKLLKLKAQKKMKSENPFNFDEPQGIPQEAEQVALVAYYTIDLGDERILLIDSYCNKCKSKAIRLLSTKTRRLICTGCGKELAKL